MARKTEIRTYETKNGETLKYKVYYVQERSSPAIEEGECLRLALEAGCHSIKLNLNSVCLPR
ncbi:MAG: hypothetical protein PHP64_08420 [Actinomycetota bacterium]|nr:hypothetical protein [Actinomycetota bacterium]